jgi:molecular chaperone DnaK
MVTDAKSHAAEDKKKREMVDVRNQADQMIYQTEKNLSEMGDKLNADEKGKLEAGVGRVKEAIKSDNVEELKSSTEALTQLWNEMASKMYQQTEQAGAQEPPSSDSAEATVEQETKDEKVEEADFEVVDDDKSKK